MSSKSSPPKTAPRKQTARARLDHKRFVHAPCGMAGVAVCDTVTNDAPIPSNTLQPGPAFTAIMFYPLPSSQAYLPRISQSSLHAI